jgi:hypothetical protein
MTSRARMSRMVKQLFEHDSVELARAAGLRQRKLTFVQVAFILVLGWWKQPQAGPSALARFAGSLGVSIEKQGLDCHFTERTAAWLLALLRRAVEYVVCANAVSLPLLQQFRAVLIEDGSSISLPSVLQTVWSGCGGRAAKAGKDAKTQAALKITVRWDLLAGRLHGPYLQEGRQHERSLVLREQVILPGSLWIADLGYWSLKWLRGLSQQGVSFLMRYKAGIVLWSDKQRLDLLRVVLLSCWDDPHRRLSGVAEVLREQVPTLVHGLIGHLPLARALGLMLQRVRGGCSIPKRSTRLSTSYRLLATWEPGLT